VVEDFLSLEFDQKIFVIVDLIGPKSFQMADDPGAFDRAIFLDETSEYPVLVFPMFTDELLASGVASPQKS
jgi:hypothetical protein